MSPTLLFLNIYVVVKATDAILHESACCRALCMHTVMCNAQTLNYLTEKNYKVIFYKNIPYFNNNYLFTILIYAIISL